MSIRDEITSLRKSLVRQGLMDRFQQLERPAALKSAFYVLVSWTLIIASWIVVSRGSIALFPMALVIIGSRQRALGALLHDASHGNVGGRNDWVRCLLALPSFEDFAHYQRQHMLHHAYAGHAERDPDYLDIASFGGGKDARGLVLYGLALTSPRLWKESVFGGLLTMKNRARAKVALFWMAILGTLSLVFGPLGAFSFFGLWMLARATVYHAIRVFTELCDHVGLEPRSVTSYTRNSPRDLFSVIVHAHNDNYHLLHHLAPRVPMASLHEAHDVLMQVDTYRNGHHCDSYFFGPSSVLANGLGASMPAHKSTRSVIPDGGEPTVRDAC